MYSGFFKPNFSAILQNEVHVQYNNVSVNTMNKSVGSYTRKDHTHARIKTKQITKLYRCTGSKMASLRFHGFLLAQLVPLLQHGGWRARCSASSAVSLESVEGPLGFPHSSRSSLCFLSSSFSCSVFAGGTFGLAALSRAINIFVLYLI